MRRRLNTTVLTFLLAILVVISMVGCNKENVPAANDEKTSQPVAAEQVKDDKQDTEEAEPIKEQGTAWPIPADQDVNSNVWTDIYKTAFPNFEIEWIIVPDSSLAEKKNILIGTGDMPDITTSTDIEFANWASRGLIQPLDELIAEYYPNQSMYFDEQVQKYSFSDGKQYGILTSKNPLENPNTLHIRKRLDGKARSIRAYNIG